MQANDIRISDFGQAEVARLQRDSLWDALVTKSGDVIETFSSNGNNHPITTVGPFSDGLAWVQSREQYGFINIKGEVAIPFQYQQALPFSNGTALVKVNNRFGVIDKKGSLVIPAKYAGIAPSATNTFPVKERPGAQGLWGAVNKQGKQVLPFQYEWLGPVNAKGQLQFRENGKLGVMTTSGKIVVPAQLEADYLSPFTNGLAISGREAYDQQTANGIITNYRYYGLVNEQGQQLAPTMYSSVSQLVEAMHAEQGIAALQHAGGTDFYNYLGQKILSTSYTAVPGFEEIWKLNKGIAPAYLGNKIGYIDHTGKVFVPVQYSFIDSSFVKIYTQGSGYVQAIKAGKYGLLDASGKEAVPFLYDWLSEPKAGYVVAQQGSKFGLLNTNGEEQLAFEYDGLRFVSGSTKPLLEVRKLQPRYYLLSPEGKWVAESPDSVLSQSAPAYIVTDQKGNKGLTTAAGATLLKNKFREVYLPSEGFIRVRTSGKSNSDRRYGYYSIDGNEAVSPQYVKAEDFSEGLAAVNVRGRWGYIDATGKQVIAPKFQQAGSFGSGYAVVNKKQIINRKGEVVGTYNGPGTIISTFSNERAVVETEKGYFHIRPDGQPAYYALYDEVTAFAGDKAAVARGEQWVLYRSGGVGAPTEINFTKRGREAYLAEFGFGRFIKTPDGRYLKDSAWVQVQQPQWRIIDPAGHYPKKIAFSEVTALPDGYIRFRLNEHVGLLSPQGTWLAEPKWVYLETKGGTVRLVGVREVEVRE